MRTVIEDMQFHRSFDERILHNIVLCPRLLVTMKRIDRNLLLGLRNETEEGVGIL